MLRLFDFCDNEKLSYRKCILEIGGKRKSKVQSKTKKIEFIMENDILYLF